MLRRRLSEPVSFYSIVHQRLQALTRSIKEHFTILTLQG